MDFGLWRRRLAGLLERVDVVDVENGSMHSRVRWALAAIADC